MNIRNRINIPAIIIIVVITFGSFVFLVLRGALVQGSATGLIRIVLQGLNDGAGIEGETHPNPIPTLVPS